MSKSTYKELEKHVKKLEETIVEKDKLLKQIERRLDFIIQESEGIIWEQDCSGKYTYYKGNDKIGLNVDDVREKTAYDFFPKKQADVFMKRFKKVIKTGKKINLQNKVEWNGEVLWTLDTLGPVYNESKDVVCVIGVSKFITELKKVEEELKFQAMLLDQIQDHVTATDTEGNIIYVNDAVVKNLKTSREELLGKSVKMYGEDISRGAAQSEIIEKTLKHGKWRGEVINYNKDGNEIIMDCRTKLVNDEGSKPAMLVGISTDITQRKKIEKEIDDQRKFLETIFNKVDASIFVVDVCKDGAFRYAGNNTVHQRGLGLKSEDFIGKRPQDLIPKITPDYAAEVENNYRKCVEEEKTIEYEETFTLNGNSIVTNTRLTPIKDSDGRICRMIGISTDITEKKEMEKKLRISMVKYKTIFDVLPVGITVSDNTGNILECNRLSSVLLGLSEEEHVQRKIDGREWHIIRTDGSPMPPEEFASTRALKNNCLIENVEMGIVKDGGKVTWITVASAPIPLEGYGVAIVYTDITYRKQIEKSLHESENLLRVAINSMLDSFLIFKSNRDETGKICDFIFVDLNNRAEDMLQMKRDQLIGKKMCEILPVNKTSGHFDKYKNVVETGIPLEEKFFLPETHVPAMWCIHQVVRLGDGIAITHRDITEQKNLEDQLQIRQRMDSLGTLAGGIAHDFNNLLVGIMGNIDLFSLESEELTDIQKKYLKDSIINCQRAASLIKQFQMFSTGFVSEKSSVDVYDTAEEVFGLLKETTDRLIEKRVKIEKGKYFAAISNSELHQVFMNLGTNAVQAVEEKGPGSGGYINISAEKCIVKDNDAVGPAEGEYVHITFEDNGVGMSDDIKRKIFDPFFTTRELSIKKGQGLGLAMVYNIVVRNCKGHLSVESSEGKGTMFHIYLPKAQPEKQEELEESIGAVQGDETVLIIEDEEAQLNLVKKILNKYGYTVLKAEDGQKGLDIYIKNKDSIDLVILDLVMPKMSGDKVFEEMVKINNKVKVIISSGHSEEKMQKGIFTFAKGFISKPFRIKEFIRKVRAVLDMDDENPL